MALTTHKPETNEKNVNINYWTKNTKILYLKYLNIFLICDFIIKKQTHKKSKNNTKKSNDFITSKMMVWYFELFWLKLYQWISCHTVTFCFWVRCNLQMRIRYVVKLWPRTVQIMSCFWFFSSFLVSWYVLSTKKKSSI